ncbi:MAG: HTTM domain-containing protein [Myxococcota bacterium]
MPRMLRDPWARVRKSANEPVDASSLALFRAAFGVLMCVAALRFVGKGWVSELILRPSFHFTYPAFDFVKPWPALGMHLHYLALAGLALAIALGFYYRLATAAFLLGFAYIELIDQALYLNHYYLVTLLTGLLLVLPLGWVHSLDARRRPERRLTHVPRWMLWALRLQVGVVYFYAGVAKLNADWLFEAQPLRIWLPARADLPLVGWLLEEPATAYVASWFGALFDLSIPFLLCLRSTRVFAFCLVVVFHTATAALFPIGIFPWLMTLSATLFFAPDWPRAVWAKFRGHAQRVEGAGALASYATPTWLVLLLGVHSATQLLLPLRQFVGPGPSAWTLAGFNFTWNVMVAEKSGHVTFHLQDRASGEESVVDPRSFLSRFQELAMAQDPALVRQAAQFLATNERKAGREVAVYAEAIASLNGRPAQPLIDPSVDLTRTLPSDWLVPLGVTDQPTCRAASLQSPACHRSRR